MRAGVDESGDPGLRRGASSPFLVIACVVTSDHAAVEEEVRRFQRKNSWSQGREMKFEGTSPRNRLATLQWVRTLPIEAHALTIDKWAITIPYREILPDLYQFALRRCLVSALNGRSVDLVIIDQVGRDKLYKQRVRTGLRQFLNGPPGRGARMVGEVAIRDSEHEVLLQLADMVAGSVRYMRATGNPSFRDVIEPILEEEIWPEIANDL